MTRAAVAFVWLVWVVCTVTAVVVIWSQGPLLPWSDDWNMIPIVAGTQPLDLAWLFAQHNEHRIALPKLVFVTVAKVGGGDYRLLILVNLALLSGTAALLIAVARKIRGHTSLTDAFLPLLLLRLDQGALVWGFHFQFTSATVLCCALLALCLWQGLVFTPLAAVIAGGGLLLLPLCGGNGLLYVPLLASWLGLRGLRQWRSSAVEPGHRRQRYAGICLFSASLGAVLLSATYFIGYQPTQHPWPTAGVLLTLRTACHVLNSAVGSLVEWAPVRAYVVTTAFLLLSLGLVVRQAVWVREQQLLRLRLLDLAVFLSACLVLALGVGYGRGGRPWEAGLTVHYATLALPALATAYLAAIVSQPRSMAVGVQSVLFVVTAAIAWPSFTKSAQFASSRRSSTAAVLADLRAGVPAATISERHVQTLFFEDSPNARTLVEDGVRQLRRAGFERFGPASAP